MRKNTKQKIMAAVGAVAIGVAGIATGFVLDNPEPVVKYVNQTIEVPVEKIVNHTVVEEKIVEVDNGDLDLVLEYLEDNYGDDYLVFEDVRDIVENIKMEDEYKNKALDMFEVEWKDYVDAPAGYVLSDGKIVRIRDEKVKAIDYDDKEFIVTFEAEIEFEDDDSKVTRYYNVTYDFDLDRDDEEDVQVSVDLI